MVLPHILQGLLIDGEIEDWRTCRPSWTARTSCSGQRLDISETGTHVKRGGNARFALFVLIVVRGALMRDSTLFWGAPCEPEGSSAGLGARFSNWNSAPSAAKTRFPRYRNLQDGWAGEGWRLAVVGENRNPEALTVVRYSAHKGLCSAVRRKSNRCRHSPHSIPTVGSSPLRASASPSILTSHPSHQSASNPRQQLAAFKKGIAIRSRSPAHHRVAG